MTKVSRLMQGPSSILKLNKVLPLILFFSIVSSSCSSINWSDDTPAMTNADLLFDTGDPNAFRIIWSPIGDKIAFTSIEETEGLENKISILDIETGQVQIFVDKTGSSPGQLVYPLAWSPDGKKLVFKSAGGSSMENGIWIADADDFDSAFFIGDGFDAAWSSIGGIALRRGGIMGRLYNYQEKGEMFILGYDLDSGFESLLFSLRGNWISSLSWSPDGTKLTFSMEGSSEYGAEAIYVGDLITGEVTKLTNDIDFFYDSAWSPTHNLIAYTKWDSKWRSQVNMLYIIRADGRCAVEVPGLGDIWKFSWSPDGEKIAFLSDGVIYTVDLVKIFGEKLFAESWFCPKAN